MSTRSCPTVVRVATLAVLVSALGVHSRSETQPSIAPPPAPAPTVAGADGTQTTPAQPVPTDPNAQQPRPPSFRIGTNYVRVDVYPTKDGTIVPDLTQDDFEVYEDGVKQKIEAFEKVVVQQRTTGLTAREPSSVAESRAMAEDPNARIFILFLDTYYTRVASSHRMRTAISSFLERVLGPDDLVGVMTPEMSAADVTLARKTQMLDRFLQQNWYWGRRDRLADRDPEEDNYLMCFPERDLQTGGQSVYAGVAREMIERRREALVMGALEDLVRWLEGVREERKAVITVSEGWRLYRPNQALTRVDEKKGAPPPPTVGIDPMGRITGDLNRSTGSASQSACELDRQKLAMVDTWQQFHDLLDRANRANVSFYPVDPRGLPVFDTGIEETKVGPGGITQPLATPAQDAALLSTRLDSLRTLAGATDGLAVMGSNDIEGGLARIVSDMTSYYLLGYYASNAALDGKFRAIKVRVTRPGIQVRARRGYRAATRDEVATSAKAVDAAAGPSAFEGAMATLATASTAGRLSTHLAWMPTPNEQSNDLATVWTTVELDPTVTKSAEWTGGGTIDLAITGAGGAAIAQRRVELPSGSRAVRVEFTDVVLPAGEITARVRVVPAGGGLPLTDVSKASSASASPRMGEPRLSRRNPTTGLLFVPTADRRFRRTDRLQAELVLPPGATVKVVEMLDRRGTPFQVPVTFTPKPPSAPGAASPGVAEIALAPFAAGDYALRFTIASPAGDAQVFVPFRVVQ